MRYFYKMTDMWKAQPKEKNYYIHGELADAYWTREDIRKIPLYEETAEITNDYSNNERSEWLPVFNNREDWRTWETDYADKDAAYRDMRIDFNQAIYDFRNDI